MYFLEAIEIYLDKFPAHATSTCILLELLLIYLFLVNTYYILIRTFYFEQLGSIAAAKSST
jgi:hypothetical protein